MANWSKSAIPDLSGKLVVVTGGNSGIGWEAARLMAGRGASVILACRNADKAKSAVDAIRSAAPQSSVEAMALDLASLESVRSFADALGKKHDRLDLLINNAGLMALPYGKTEDGFEVQFGVNHLGHFALTGLVMPLLGKSAAPRVVNVSSQAHRMGRMRWDDLMFERSYDRWAAYGQSKLANLLFTFELARRAPKRIGSLLATAAHPGYSATNLQSKGTEMGGPKIDGFFMRIGNGMLAQDAESGAMPTVRAATDPAAANGDYYGPKGLFEIGGPPVKVGTASAARDEASQKRLWERSVALTGVDYDGL